MTFRILVTGSRDWTDRDTIYRALNDVCRAAGLMFEPDEYGNTLPDPSKVTLVHGGCPTGADLIAGDWAIGSNLMPEVYHAEWDTHGKRAGFMRNRQMVEDGASICLAFIRPCTKHPLDNHGSHGADHTATLAEKAGINTWRFTVERGTSPAVPGAGRDRDPGPLGQQH